MAPRLHGHGVLPEDGEAAVAGHQHHRVLAHAHHRLARGGQHAREPVHVVRVVVAQLAARDALGLAGLVQDELGDSAAECERGAFGSGPCSIMPLKFGEYMGEAPTFFMSSLARTRAHAMADAGAGEAGASSCSFAGRVRRSFAGRACCCAMLLPSSEQAQPRQLRIRAAALIKDKSSSSSRALLPCFLYRKHKLDMRRNKLDMRLTL